VAADQQHRTVQPYMGFPVQDDGNGPTSVVPAALIAAASNGRTSGAAGPGRVVVAPQRPATVDYALIERIKNLVNSSLDKVQETRETPLDDDGVKQLARQLIEEALQGLARDRTNAGQAPLRAEEEQRVRAAVFSALFGLGRIEPLLNDPDVEDIVITGTRPVYLLYSDGRQELAPPVADTNEELLNQLQLIATHHGQNERQVSASMPFLNMRLPDGSRLAAMWSITPEPHIVIRKHRFVDISLADLVRMGTLSGAMAAFLSAAVAGKCNILVVGSPRAGKTTLLRALARCLPAAERVATLETEYELLLHELRDERGELRWPHMLPCETRPGTGEVLADGRVIGEVNLEHLLPQSLRMSVDRVIVGEARGPEVEPMLMAMLRGYPGSMSTFHANSAHSSFDGLGSLLMSNNNAWNRESAQHFIASALDLIVYVDYVDIPGGRQRFVTEIVEVTGPGEGARPATTTIFGPNPQLESAGDPRGYPLHQPESTRGRLRRVGFNWNWLSEQHGGWENPFPHGGRSAA
jgi:pilus assembly protein CpaF